MAAAYEVGLRADKRAGLPECASTIQGTVAQVQEPLSLWVCRGHSWQADAICD